MNTINYDKNNFPLATDVLAFLQASCQMLEKLTAFVGGNYILSGCEVMGSAVNPGHVVINGELMPFKGGTLQEYARVIAREENVTIQDGNYTTMRKEFQFGAGSGQIQWNSLRRAGDLLSLIEKKSDKGHGHSWGDIEEKPGSYPPSQHQHDGADISNATATDKGTVRLASQYFVNHGIDKHQGRPLVVQPSHLVNLVGESLKRKVLLIGFWNMKDNLIHQVATNVPFSQIIRVTASIIPDDNAEIRNLQGKHGDVVVAKNGTIGLLRFAGGHFVDNNFSSTTTNRGYIIIEYRP